MCTGIEIALIAGSAISAVGAVQQGKQAKKMGEFQQAQAMEDAKAEREASADRAEKIRKIGQLQKSSARSALAKSGVVADAGTALTIQSDIIERTESDAVSEILTGENKGRRFEQEGQMARLTGNNAYQSGILGAGKSVLSGGYQYSTLQPGWKVQQ